MYNSTYIRGRIMVAGANPNGDPDAENYPRMCGNKGVISSNCIKMRLKQEMFKIIQNNGYTNKTIARCPENPNTMSNLVSELKQDKDKFYNKYLDLKLFGFVAASASVGAAGHSRGIVTVEHAFSEMDVGAHNMTITCGTNDEDAEKKSSSSIGKQYFVGSEDAPVFYSLNIVADWGVSKYIDDTDIEIFLEAVRTLYTNSYSAARPIGTIEVKELAIIHNNGKLVMPSKVFNGLTPSEYVLGNPEFIVA